MPWPEFIFLSGICKRKEERFVFKEERFVLHSICGFEKRNGMIGTALLPTPACTQLARGRSH
jgi:hypothetical protein